MREIACFVVEYDENGVATLLHVDGHERIVLEHGGLLTLESYTAPRYPEPAQREGAP
jgi:hypothetical protein